MMCISLTINSTATLETIFVPENTSNKNVIWESENENVATINNGVVTAINYGTTSIKATTEDGNLKSTCVVTVEEIAKQEMNYLQEDLSDHSVYQTAQCGKGQGERLRGKTRKRERVPHFAGAEDADSVCVGLRVRRHCVCAVQLSAASEHGDIVWSQRRDYFRNADQHQRNRSHYRDAADHDFSQQTHGCAQNSHWREPDRSRLVRVSLCAGSNGAVFYSDDSFYDWGGVQYPWTSAIHDEANPFHSLGQGEFLCQHGQRLICRSGEYFHWKNRGCQGV